jgi:hypothetical protein
MYTGLHVNNPLFLSDLNKNLNFLERFSKNIQISNFTKIRPVGTELLHVDGQTDRQTDRHDEANSRFPQFCERGQKLFICLFIYLLNNFSLFRRIGAHVGTHSCEVHSR